MAREYNTFYKGKTIKCVDFESFTDQLNYISDFIKEDPFDTVEEVNQVDDFYGKRTFKESEDGMLYGFKEDTSYLIKTLSTMKSKKNNNEGMFLDTQGFAYDMGSVVNGEPECCLNFGLPSTKPCIRILLDIAFSYEISAKKISNRSVAVTNLIYTLLLNGCIVELYLLRYNIQDDMDVLYTVKVDVDVLPIDSISFASSVENFRKIGWVTTDCIRNKKSDWTRGCSRTTDFLVNKIKNEKWFFIGGNYTCKDMNYNLETIEKATKQINKMFRNFCEENKIYIDIDLEQN